MTDTMRALVKAKPERGMWMEEIPRPTVGHNDVLIRVTKSSICGTDVHIYNWDDWAQRTIPVPMAVGHEFSGEIAAVGQEVEGLRIGDRVSGEGHITCSHCRNCRAGRRNFCRNTQSVGVDRPGSFAEYVVIPAANVFPLPDHVSDEVGAILDPLGNATHTALTFDLVGEDVLITGSGPIGIMAAAISQHIGARHVVATDVNEYRLELAAKLGATKTVNVRDTTLDDVMRELGMTEGFDIGMEMSGNPDALMDMFRVMNHGGRIALLGIPSREVPVDWNLVIFKGLTLRGIYGRRIFETWYKMTTMLQSGLAITDVITHRFPIEEFDAAFAVMASGKSGKVILDWLS